MSEEDKRSELERSLGLSPASTRIVQEIAGSAFDDDAITDFKFVRGKQREAMELGMKAATDLADVAEQAQDPEMYQALASMLKVVISGGDKVLVAQERIRSIAKASRSASAPDGPVAGGTGQPTTVTNNLFVGSTTELQKFLQEHGLKS